MIIIIKLKLILNINKLLFKIKFKIWNILFRLLFKLILIKNNHLYYNNNFKYIINKIKINI